MAARSDADGPRNARRPGDGGGGGAAPSSDDASSNGERRVWDAATWSDELWESATDRCDGAGLDGAGEPAAARGADDGASDASSRKSRSWGDRAGDDGAEGTLVPTAPTELGTGDSGAAGSDEPTACGTPEGPGDVLPPSELAAATSDDGASEATDTETSSR